LALAGLTVVQSAVTSSALADAWQKAFDPPSWCANLQSGGVSDYTWLTGHLSVQRSVIELQVDPRYCDGLDLEKFKNVAPGLVEVTETTMAVQLAPQTVSSTSNQD
jgi:hypothetical protein